MTKRLSITRDQGRKMYNYLKSITGQEGKSSNSLNSVEDCRKAILQLISDYSTGEAPKKLLKENEHLKFQLNIQEEINDSLESDIIALIEENEKLRTKKWWKWW